MPRALRWSSRSYTAYWGRIPAPYRSLFPVVAVGALFFCALIPLGDICANFLTHWEDSRGAKEIAAKAAELPLTFKKAAELLEAQSPAGREVGDFPIGHAVVWCVNHPQPHNSYVRSQQGISWTNENAVPRTLEGKAGRCLPMAAVIRGWSDQGPLLEYKGQPGDLFAREKSL